MNKKHEMVEWLMSLTSNILTWVQIPADAISPHDRASTWSRDPGPGRPTQARGAHHRARGTASSTSPGSARGSRHYLEPPARGPPMHCLEHQPADPRLEAGASSWGGSPALPGARGSASTTSSRTAQLELGQLTSDRLELGSAPAQGDSSWGGPRRTTPARGASSWALFWLGGLTTLS
ncbi:hypothetical protein Salat_1889400 [Sesamum alatum]|uniref:Uncharacterized protein n=1 Tax=Sesamum alatum TaxID=300844 RepID=A0AAE1Y3M1_9LAMI|nr:hypothetical protein Salat_1889400 [Sesamum alatum]